MTTALPKNEVHLWCVAWTRLTDPALLARYESLLTEEETTSYRRFYFEEGRREYLMTRALVRDVLSRYEPDVAPARWRFVRSSYGRPSIAPELGVRNLVFNLSNTKGLVVCAVGRDELGCDVEPIDRGEKVLPIADSVFSPNELATLRALPEAKQTRRAIELWTLKESFIKARGMGLSLPLDRFTMVFEGDASATPAGASPAGASPTSTTPAGASPRIVIRIDPSIDIAGQRWQLALLPMESHLVALCMERGGSDADKSVLVRHIVPLEG
ncbi:4'-phosphopantetheinyl transferase family protein [Pendulispora albinea]|uniref:4'-phosphopantetheinyl transferase superfamily protein n=1 Tax=Pendulispora albinea TaxID=2741071 RepID=A0ABZ2LTB4_9BACT